MRTVSAALSTGNVVVLKPDPNTPISGGVIIARAFEEAGLPKGILHVVSGEKEAGEALCLARDVQMIQFTGLTATGRRIDELAGKTLKKVSVELGGNNAPIVLDDADLELAVNNAVWGAFLHQGQICMASSRIFVQNTIRQEFTLKFSQQVAALKMGHPGDAAAALGPVINERQLDRLQSIVQASVSAGAGVETGGGYKGLYHEATVPSGVKPGMRAFEEETFGPVANLIGFDTDEDAIGLANLHDAALAAAVISRSVGRATRIAETLNAAWSTSTIRPLTTTATIPSAFRGWREREVASGVQRTNTSTLRGSGSPSRTNHPATPSKIGQSANPNLTTRCRFHGTYGPLIWR